VPMSDDSISVMAQPCSLAVRASRLAAIQPAVPPPTIAIFRIRESSPDTQALQLELDAQEQATSGVVVRERQILELKIRVLLLVGEIHHREQHAEIHSSGLEVVADLPVELSVWRRINA